MPGPRRAGAVTAGLVLFSLLTACSTGTGTSTGRVSDAASRLCIQRTHDDGFCFQAGAALLTRVHVGDCVRVDFAGGGSGRDPEATGVHVATSGCPTR